MSLHVFVGELVAFPIVARRGFGDSWNGLFGWLTDHRRGVLTVFLPLTLKELSLQCPLHALRARLKRDGLPSRPAPGQVRVLCGTVPRGTTVYVLKILGCTLAGMAGWAECRPVNQTVAGSIPSQDTCPGCWRERQPHIDVSLFLSPFPSLKINK